MKINNTSKRFQVLAIGLLLVVNYPYSPSFARTVSDLDYADVTKLAGLETTIFGSPHKNFPSEKRIDSLETILFGKPRNGPFHPRIYALALAINGSQNNLLSPPVAPELDRSSPISSNSSEPPLAPEATPTNESDTLLPSEAHSERIKSMLQEAMQLYGQGQIAQAETIFKNVLKLDSKNPDANFNLAAIAEGRSDWQGALHYYKVAQKSNPDDPEIKNAIASMETKIADTHQNINRAASNPPKLSSNQIANLKARANQASSDYERGNYDAAINNLKAVLAQAPDQPDVYYALAQAYRAKGLNQEAIAALNQASKLDPSNQQYRDTLAELANANSQPQTAGQDTFASNNYNQNTSKGKYKPQKNTNANNYAENNLANAPDSSAATGQITPFSDDSSRQVGWQSAATSYTSTGAYLPGLKGYVPSYSYSNSIPYSMSSRVQRAAMGSLAGAAIGSMFGSRGSHSKGAMTGALVGGMLGLMGGHW